MGLKKLCLLLTGSSILVLSLVAWALANELPAEVAPSPDPSSVSSPTAAPDPSSIVEDSDAPLLVTSASAPPLASGQSPRVSQLSAIDFGLEEIVASLEKVLPQTWSVASIKRRQVPRKWTGPSEAVLIRIEDGSVVVHHPNGFDYHPFYKLWLCPSAWQGSMEDVSILGDEGPSLLLGINHRMKVFYLALGANTWPEGPEVLRKTLDLTALSITGSLKQILDSSMKMMLVPRLAATENSSPGLLSRVVGMEKDGPLVYLEYATATGKQIDGVALASRCKEPRVTSLMERENLFLADQVFFAYPEVRTVYVRRVCDESLSDKIIDRPGATSASPAVVSDSTP